MISFSSISTVNPNTYRGAAVLLFKHTADERIWVAKSRNVQSRLQIVHNAIRNGHYGTGLVPKDLIALTEEPSQMQVMVIPTDKDTLDEQYDDYRELYIKQGLIANRKRDCDKTTYGFAVLTHPLYPNDCYYFKYKRTYGFKRATLALRQRCLDLSFRSIMRRGLGVWLAGRSLCFINRLEYTEVPGVYATGSAAARDELKRLVRLARAQGKLVYNHTT